VGSARALKVRSIDMLVMAYGKYLLTYWMSVKPLIR
jgi:hypothetical protein